MIPPYIATAKIFISKQYQHHIKKHTTQKRAPPKLYNRRGFPHKNKNLVKRLAAEITQL